MDTPLSQLHGVYDASASDRWGTTSTLGELIGRRLRYMGSDGCQHSGAITAICDGRERFAGLIAVFSSGYTDGLWMSLGAAVEALQACLVAA